MTVAELTDQSIPPMRSFWRSYWRYVAIGLWITFWSVMLWNPAHAPILTACTAIFANMDRPNFSWITWSSLHDFGAALAAVWSDPRVIGLTLLGVALSAVYSVRFAHIKTR